MSARRVIDAVQLVLLTVALVLLLAGRPTASAWLALATYVGALACRRLAERPPRREH